MELAGHLQAPGAVPSGTETNAPISIRARCGLDLAEEENNDYFCWESNPDFPARKPFTVLTKLPRCSSLVERNKWSIKTNIRL
jgi:hypothetical protein